MATTLHSGESGLDLHDPVHFAQSADPGAVGAGKWWLDTTNANNPVLRRRNAGNTAWVVVTLPGNVVRPIETIPAYGFTNVQVIGANVAHLVKIRVPDEVPITTATYYLGVSNGNLDIGIYSSADGGTTLDRVTSTGSIAAGTATSLNTVALAFTPTYGEDYWVALVTDSATFTTARRSFSGFGTLPGHGARYVAKSATFPLPAQITGWSADDQIVWVALA